MIEKENKERHAHKHDLSEELRGLRGKLADYNKLLAKTFNPTNKTKSEIQKKRNKTLRKIAQIEEKLKALTI